MPILKIKKTFHMSLSPLKSEELSFCEIEKKILPTRLFVYHKKW